MPLVPTSPNIWDMVLPLILEWQRDADGYRVERRTHTGVLDQGPYESDHIVPVGGKPAPYHPLKTPDLYLRFSEIDSTDAVLRFVNRFGLLTRTWEDRRHGETVDMVLRSAADLRSLVKSLAGARGDGTRVRLSRAISINLVLGPKRKLQFEPATLLWGLWLQAVSRQVDIRQCLFCEAFFEVGPNSKPRRRGDSLYCSSEHQKRDKSLKRSL